MPSQTNEAALEACIERHLTGGVSVMPAPVAPFGDEEAVFQTSKGAGYQRGKSTDFNTKFESNIFSVTRQVYFSSIDHKSVDMVVFLNGLPIATLELKNPWTGQNVNHAKKQYRDDRDPKEPLF